MNRLLLSLLGLIYLSIIVLNVEAGEGEGVSSDDQDDEDEVYYNKTYAEHQSALQSAIFKNYNRLNRPVKAEQTTVEIELHLHVTHIAFNQHEQTMIAHGHMYMSWFDELLAWDPKDYAGVVMTNVKKWQIWMPDVRVSNSVNGIYSVHDISRNAHITLTTYSDDNGKTYKKAKVETYPTFAIKVGCLMDFTEYPYDDHHCSIRIFTPNKARQVRLTVYRMFPPTMFLSWTNETQKTIVGPFDVYYVSNNISYYRFGEGEDDRAYTGNDLVKAWSIYNMHVFYKRVSATYFATIVLPLASSTTLSLLTLLLRNIQFSTIVNGLTFFIHQLFINEFGYICPVSVYEVPRAMAFHGWSVGLTVFIFCFHLTLWIMKGTPTAQQKMIEAYSKVYNSIPFNPYPGFLTGFVKDLGDIRSRGWAANVSVWRKEMCTILTFLYLILFSRAFLI